MRTIRETLSIPFMVVGLVSAVLAATLYWISDFIAGVEEQ